MRNMDHVYRFDTVHMIADIQMGDFKSINESV